MKMIFRIKFILFITLIFYISAASYLNGCASKEETNHQEESKHEDEHSGEVVLTDEQINIMEIEFTKIQNQNISGYIRVNGEVMINQDQESKVGSIIPGRVNNVYVKEGSYVKAGQVLALVENPELIDVQINYINAKNEYDYAKTEYERQLKLSRDNIGSKKNLAELESNYKRALANYKTLEQKLSSYKISKNRLNDIYQDTVANLQRYYSVTSPISGNVISRMVTLGQFIEPSIEMFHIVNTSTVYVDLNVFEKDLSYISIGQKVTLEVNVNPYEFYEGTISFINKVFDDKNRTVKVRVAINNKNGKLLPFMFITAKIYVNENSVLAVPITAIETEGEEKYIFVKTNEVKEIKSNEEHQHEKETKHEENEADSPKSGIVFKKVIVNTGISDEKYVEIFPIDEISENEDVVSKGTFYLKSELKKSELSGHED